MHTWLRAGSLTRSLVSRSLASMAPKRKAQAQSASPSEDGPSQAKAPKAKRAAKPKAPKPPPGPAWLPSMRPPPLPPGTPGSRILCWNVAGLRALLKKLKEVEAGTREKFIPTLMALAETEQADVICLQEVKLQEKDQDDVMKELALPEGWHISWNCSRDKKGYSGVAILSRQAPLSVDCGIGDEAHDGEGRVITAEFPNFYSVNCYTPNSGEGLKRLDYRLEQWDKEFSAYVKRLEQRKPVVIAGDLNVAPEEIDIHSPKTNLKSAGFTPEERESYRKKLVEQGFLNCFRSLYPDAVAYTYWTYRFNCRSKNKGWRLDHFLVSQQLHGNLHDCYHLPEIMGSDHCPLGLVLKL